MGPPNEIPCCIEAPGDFAVKAQYALQMLLMPLGLNPKWVKRELLVDHGIYYGASSEEVSSLVLCIPLHADTLEYFQGQIPYPISKTVWRFWENERWPVLFGGPGEEEDDFVASTFFWLSGWQEYTQRRRDFHGRFPFEASLQAVLGIGEMPCVDAYRERVGLLLQEKGISIKAREWNGQSWAFCPTHDIDYIKKWRAGMIYREIVQYLLFNQLRQSLPKRILRFGAFIIDLIKPRDIFWASLKRMIKETQARGGTGTYFFKTSAHGPRDVYYSVQRHPVKRLFSWLLAHDFEIGLHPSYYAFDHQGYMQEEKKRLEEACKHPIGSVRQHYLRYTESTSRLHAAEGFSIDSTIAFANHEGFRRGTCLPFQLFDIRANQVIDLWELPLCMMDGTLFNYRQLDGKEALEVSIELMRWCMRFGGVCVGLWHNMLWDEMDFPEWGDHFIGCLDFAVQEGAYIGSLQKTLASYLGTQT